MTTDWKALCAELLTALVSWSPAGGGPLEGEEAEAEANLISRARAALAQPEPEGPQPIPVSERLPGPDLCWWFTPESDEEYGWWVLETYGMEREPQPTHWLPAHALPIPRSEND
jgi:hypothetical protein